LSLKLREIESQYQKVHQGVLSLEKQDLSKTEFKDFLDKFSQKSMFTQTKLFFIENIFANEKFKRAFLKSIEKFVSSKDIIVVIERKDLKKSKFFSELKSHSTYQEFRSKNIFELRRWVKNEFLKYDSVINELGLNCLLSVSLDPWFLSEEIKKLASFKKNINKEDVLLFSAQKTEAVIFKTIDALAERNQKRALLLIQEHIEAGDNSLYILSMIAYQFRSLLLVKTTDDKKRLGMKPFVLNKLVFLCQKFTLLELKNIFTKIFDLDSKIKTGRILPEQGIRSLISEI